MQAAKILADDGIDVAVINARFAAPIDESILEGVLPIITLEDHRLDCGFGSALLETANRLGKTNLPIVIISGPKEFIRHDTRCNQLISIGINADNIAKNARILIGQNQSSIAGQGPIISKD